MRKLCGFVVLTLATSVQAVEIRSLQPNRGPSSGRTRVLVTGTGFEPTDEVVFASPGLRSPAGDRCEDGAPVCESERCVLGYLRGRCTIGGAPNQEPFLWLGSTQLQVLTPSVVNPEEEIEVFIRRDGTQVSASQTFRIQNAQLTPTIHNGPSAFAGDECCDQGRWQLLILGSGFQRCSSVLVVAPSGLWEILPTPDLSDCAMVRGDDNLSARERLQRLLPPDGGTIDCLIRPDLVPLRPVVASQRFLHDSICYDGIATRFSQNGAVMISSPDDPTDVTAGGAVTWVNSAQLRLFVGPTIRPPPGETWEAEVFVSNAPGRGTDDRLVSNATPVRFTNEATPGARLRVERRGGINGRVLSTPPGIDLSGLRLYRDESTFASGTVVTLTASPPEGFVRWGGDCSGTDVTTTVTVDAALACTAEFTGSRLTVTRSGDGGGQVRDSNDISCGSSCASDYPLGTEVTLIATPDAGSSFAGWQGDCDVDGRVTMDADRSCVATFTSNVRRLTIHWTSTGDGDITSDPPGIDCRRCTAVFAPGTSVALRVKADDGSIFQGWTGDCTGRDLELTVAMDRNRTCTATFDEDAGIATEVTPSPAGPIRPGDELIYDITFAGSIAAFQARAPDRGQLVLWPVLVVTLDPALGYRPGRSSACFQSAPPKTLGDGTVEVRCALDPELGPVRVVTRARPGAVPGSSATTTFVLGPSSRTVTHPIVATPPPPPPVPSLPAAAVAALLLALLARGSAVASAPGRTRQARVDLRPARGGPLRQV